MPVRRLRLIHSPTPEWEAVRDFYVEVLGLEETAGWDLPGDRGAFLAAGGGEIEVMEQDVGALGIFPGGSAGWHLALEVENAEAEHQRLRSLGTAVEGDVRRQPWGTRDFIVRDPAGNPVLIFDSGSDVES